jgi:RNA polymerase sigma-70 factor (ECF subfamily)
MAIEVHVNPFEALVEQHRATLRLHCYRMLGSSHDSEDMVQETFVRAFRALHTLQGPATARAWLHRIATNVCIDELAKRPRRARGPELGPPADPDAPLAAPTPDDEWLEPAPSAWLSGATLEGGSPASQYTLKESIALAFVAALQVLTPSPVSYIPANTSHACPSPPVHALAKSGCAADDVDASPDIAEASTKHE